MSDLAQVEGALVISEQWLDQLVDEIAAEFASEVPASAGDVVVKALHELRRSLHDFVGDMSDLLSIPLSQLKSVGDAPPGLLALDFGPLWLAPQFQFTQAGELEPAIAAINSVLLRDDPPWVVLSWWLGPRDDLAGWTPLQVLEVSGVGAETLRGLVSHD